MGGMQARILDGFSVSRKNGVQQERAFFRAFFPSPRCHPGVPHESVVWRTTEQTVIPAGVFVENLLFPIWSDGVSRSSAQRPTSQYT